MLAFEQTITDLLLRENHLFITLNPASQSLLVRTDLALDNLQMIDLHTKHGPAMQATRLLPACDGYLRILLQLGGKVSQVNAFITLSEQGCTFDSCYVANAGKHITRGLQRRNGELIWVGGKKNAMLGNEARLRHDPDTQTHEDWLASWIYTSPSSLDAPGNPATSLNRMEVAAPATTTEVPIMVTVPAPA